MSFSDTTVFLGGGAFVNASNIPHFPHAKTHDDIAKTYDAFETNYFSWRCAEAVAAVASSLEGEEKEECGNSRERLARCLRVVESRLMEGRNLELLESAARKKKWKEEREVSGL